jgi:hypothetical protein
MNGPQTQTGRSWLPKWLKCCKRGRQLEAQLDVIPPVRIQRSQPEQRPPNRRTHSGSPTRTRQTTEPRPPPEPLRRQNTYAINAVPVAPQMANSFTTNRRTALAEPPQPIQTKVENTRSFRIQSAHSKVDIKVLATQPHGADKDLFRYLCPICFRYMDKILAFSCCHNYICFECVDDINESRPSCLLRHSPEEDARASVLLLPEGGPCDHRRQRQRDRQEVH